MGPTYKEIRRDLERYIEENWTGTDEAVPSRESEEELGLADFISEAVLYQSKDSMRQWREKYRPVSC